MERVANLAGKLDVVRLLGCSSDVMDESEAY
jgi:hypothetical protein